MPKVKLSHSSQITAEIQKSRASYQALLTELAEKPLSIGLTPEWSAVSEHVREAVSRNRLKLLDFAPSAHEALIEHFVVSGGFAFNWFIRLQFDGAYPVPGQRKIRKAFYTQGHFLQAVLMLTDSVNHHATTSYETSAAWVQDIWDELYLSPGIEQILTALYPPSEEEKKSIKRCNSKENNIKPLRSAWRKILYDRQRPVVSNFALGELIDHAVAISETRGVEHFYTMHFKPFCQAIKELLDWMDSPESQLYVLSTELNSLEIQVGRGRQKKWIAGQKRKSEQKVIAKRVSK